MDDFEQEEFEMDDAGAQLEKAENFIDNTEFEFSADDFIIDAQPQSSNHDQKDHNEPPLSAGHIAKMAEAEAEASTSHHHHHHNEGPSDLIELAPVEKVIREDYYHEKHATKEIEKEKKEVEKEVGKVKKGAALVKTRNYQAHENICCACDDCCGCNLFYFC